MIWIIHYGMSQKKHFEKFGVKKYILRALLKINILDT